MIEAVNKVLKIQYLGKMDTTNVINLIKLIAFSIEDYNYKRPHGSLLGNTPFETLNGHIADTNILKTKSTEARLKRIAYNRENKCNNCL